MAIVHRGYQEHMDTSINAVDEGVPANRAQAAMRVELEGETTTVDRNVVPVFPIPRFDTRQPFYSARLQTRVKQDISDSIPVSRSPKSPRYCRERPPRQVDVLCVISFVAGFLVLCPIPCSVRRSRWTRRGRRTDRWRPAATRGELPSRRADRPLGRDASPRPRLRIPARAG